MDNQPNKVGFFDTTVGKTLKAAIYVALSAGIAAILSAVSNDPMMFGPYTIIINAVLVAVKGLLTPGQRNI